jgi:DNA-binding transcriptional LysR family regulator
MLDLRRLRLLRELHRRKTIAAVADALRYTPSAVSQQLAMLEREAGVKLLERAGRGVRLTDAALVLVEHAEALLDRAERAEADLAAAAGTVAGRARISSFQSVALHIALPAIARLAREAPRLRCELIEAEPEEGLPRLAAGDLDVVLGDEWPDQATRLPAGVDRHELLEDPMLLVLPSDHPAARRHPEAVPLAELAGERWTASEPGMGWEQMTRRSCRALGGFDPDIRNRTNDAAVAFAAAEQGVAVAMLTELATAGHRGGVAIRRIEGAHENRRIFAAVRSADAARPSVRAVLDAMRGSVGRCGLRSSSPSS